MLYGTPGLWAFDVMNSDRVRPADLRGLTAFEDEHPEARRILLHRAQHRLLRRGVLCVPVEEFLLGLRPDRSLEDAVD